MKNANEAPSLERALGHTYRDLVSGFTGICTAAVIYWDGSSSLLLQGATGEDGKAVDPEWFPESRCDLIADIPRVTRS